MDFFRNAFNPFAGFDRNGDGRIMEDDFVQVAHSMGFGSLGDFMIRQLFRQVDTNHNGSLDFSEGMQVLNLLRQYSGQQ